MILVLILLLANSTLSQIIEEYKSESHWEYFTTINSPLPVNQINTIIHDSIKQTFVGCGQAGTGGLIVFKNKTWKIFNGVELGTYNRGVTAILIDKNTSRLYLGLKSNGGFGGGVLKQTSDGFERIFEREIEEGSQSDVEFLYQFDNGNIWVGYKQYSQRGINYCRGIDQISGNQISRITNTIGIPSSSFVGCFQLNDEIWVAAQTLITRNYSFGGVGRYKDNSWTTFTNDNSNFNSTNSFAMLSDKKDNVWIGTDDGLRIFSNDSISILNQSNSNIPFQLIREMDFDKYQNLWFSSSLMIDGIVKYDGSDFQQYYPNDSSYLTTYINDLSIDNNDNVWLSTNDGIIVFNENGIEYVDTTDDSNGDNLVTKCMLSSNYPNPFNSTTNINYRIPEKQHVQIDVFNIMGEHIESLVNENILPGEHHVNYNMKQQPSGVYIYRIVTGKFSKSKKMVLLK